MNRLSLFILSLLIPFVTLAQKQSYIHLEGRVGNSPVMMDISLFRENEADTPIQKYHGYYYYTSQDKPIRLYQADTMSDDVVIFKSYDDETDETFTGKLQQGRYTGQWNKGDKTLPFDLGTVQDKSVTDIVHLSQDKVIIVNNAKLSDDVQAIISFDWMVPSDKALQMALARLATDSSFMNFDSYSKDAIQKYESDYRNTISEEVATADTPVSGPFLNYEYDENFYPVLNNDKYLVMLFTTYDYEGGAHGMSGQSFYTYNKQQKKWMDIGDVLNTDYERQINYVLDKELRRQYGIPVGLKLSEAENSIFLSDSVTYSPNFTLDKQGITFHYGLYEMTPYAYGFFKFFLPYDKIRQYLNPRFKY